LKSAHSETDALSSDLNSEREAVAKLKTYIAKIQADDLARSQWEEKRKNIGIQMKVFCFAVSFIPFVDLVSGGLKMLILPIVW